VFLQQSLLPWKDSTHSVALSFRQEPDRSSLNFGPSLFFAVTGDRDGGCAANGAVVLSFALIRKTVFPRPDKWREETPRPPPSSYAVGPDHIVGL